MSLFLEITEIIITSALDDLSFTQCKIEWKETTILKITLVYIDIFIYF